MSNTKNRVIKVFISSTFRDMNDERDYLNKFVFPRIYEYCNARKIEFYPIDLRWGIQEKDSKNGLVMSTCLEQIDESRPFFIGVLGSRYGWIPTQQEVDKMRASVEKQRAWVVGKVNERASITEIEMEYGVLRNHKIAHACFLMRDESVTVPDDFRELPGSLEEGKLKALKANRVFVCTSFGLFCNGLENIDKAHEEGVINRIFTTNLVYNVPELLEKPWYKQVDMSKYLAMIVDTLNHDNSISELLDPAKRINKLMDKHNAELANK